ncbi:MAG: DUF134 domain-containing protein [Nitrososphaerota archaeon]
MFHRRWCKRYRHGKVGRAPKPIIIASIPSIEKIKPIPEKNLEAIYIELAEIEALRLIDLEKLSFEEAGLKMRISRNTVWRLVENAREKLIKAIIEGREIIIKKGE